MDDASGVARHSSPTLRSPILIAAFEGWNDAGESATFAVEHLRKVWSAETLASIDPEEFFDFQTVRPNVELVEGRTRKITWPSNSFSWARLEGHERDVIVLSGVEPNLRWRTFSRLIVEIAEEHNVELVITLGALLADVPHSRPVQITGTAMDDGLIRRLNLHRSRYEGPTGIVGVLHDAFAGAGIASASLWAAVPHYLAVSPNPKAALALVNKCVELVQWPASVRELELATRAYEERVTQLVAADEDVAAYVRMLEERTDESSQEPSFDPADLPSGDALAAELERFLRQHPEGG